MHHKRVIDIPEAESYKRFKFSPAIKVGNTLYISGQVGRSPSGEIPEDVASQARIALSSVKRVVEQAGGTLDDVVDLLTFHTDMNELPAFAEVKSEFFSREFPTWTAIGVSAIGVPPQQFKLEVKAIAAIEE